MAYIGQGPFNEFSTIPTKDTFTGDGSTTVFDMAVEVPSGSENALEVFVDNIRQEPGSGKAFTLGLDGSNVNKRITFTAAPANGAAIYVINDKTNTTTIVNPIDLGGVELILDADNDTSITADTDDQIDFKIGSADHLKILSSSGDTVLKPMVDAKDIIFQQFDGNKVFEINDGNFVSVGGNAAAPGEIRIYEDTDLGTNYSGFKVGNLTGSVAYQLPLADGNSGQALATNGSGVLSWATVAANTPTSADGQALGSASLEWSDLFLADAAVINFGADQDINITHVADTGLTTNGTFQATTITATTAFVPDASDGAALGTTALQFSDLFLADGAVINFGDDQDINLTHVADTGLTTNGDFSVGDDLTVLGGQFDLKTNSGSVAKIKFYCESGNAHAQTLQAQPHSASASDVLTLPTGGNSTLVSRISTDTLTNKTLTSPVINTGTFGTSILPTSADGTTLGSATKEFSDLFLADASTIQFGADQDVIITHVADTGILLSGTNVIQFNDASQNIGAPSNAILDINATDEIELNATLVDVNANLDVSGTITSGGVITGTAFTAGSAVLAEAELELLDGLTAGTAIASKVVTTDANIDTTGQRNLTISGELDAATLDISGDADIDGTTNLDIVDIDGAVDMASTLQVDGSITSSDGMTITVADNSNTLELISTDNDTAEGPILAFNRSVSDVAAGDLIGTIKFLGEDDAGNAALYHEIQASIEDGSNGGEDGRLTIYQSIAGATKNVLDFKSGEIIFNQDSVDLDFRVETNGQTHAIFAEGGTDRVGILNSSPQKVLDVTGDAKVSTDLTVGDDLFMLSDSAVIHFGADSDVTLTHVADKGLTLSTATGDDSLILQSTLADNNSAPRLKLHRASSSPADNDLLGAITWSFLDDGGNSHEAAFIRATATDVSNGSEDATLEVNVDVAGSNINRLNFNAVEAVFNEGGIDMDFRVESANKTNMFTINAGTDLVGIGDNPDLGAGLHIKIADSGASATAHGDELVIEDGTSGANVGISILCNANGEARINFGDSNDNDIGGIYYEHDGDRMEFVVNNAVGLNIINGPKLSSYNETAPDVDQGGLTLQQGGDDGNILSFKSSDVAHGVTAIAETDTWLDMRKNSDGGGGLLMRNFSETATAFRHLVVASGSNTAESTAATSYWSVDARKNADNTNVTGLAADDNLASFRQSDEAQFIIKGDGELFSNQSATVGTYDAYDDAQLVRAYDLNHMQGVINSKFDKFVQYNKNDLQKARLIGTDDEGNATPMVNITGMQRLHNGAIWQQYEKTQRLTQAMYKLATKTLGKEEADKLLDEEEIKLLN